MIHTSRSTGVRAEEAWTTHSNRVLSLVYGRSTYRHIFKTSRRSICDARPTELQELVNFTIVSLSFLPNTMLKHPKTSSLNSRLLWLPCARNGLG